MFITFEGFECAGKSSVVEYVAEELERQGVACVASREPGGTQIGWELRHLLFSHANAMEPATETMLFYSDRIEHNAKVIRPALAAGKVVISDRYYDTTLAYQGALEEASPATQSFPEMLHAFMGTTSLLARPDLTLLFDVDLETYKARKRARGVVKGEEVNTFEDGRNDAYHARVIEGFRKIARENAERYVVIDACQSFERVREEVLQAVLGALSSAAR